MRCSILRLGAAACHAMVLWNKATWPWLFLLSERNGQKWMAPFISMICPKLKRLKRFCVEFVGVLLDNHVSNWAWIRR